MLSSNWYEKLKTVIIGQKIIEICVPLRKKPLSAYIVDYDQWEVNMVALSIKLAFLVRE